MQAPKIYPIVLLLLSLWSFQGCEQIIEVDPPEHQARLTVNSTFSPDSLWFVHLSASLGILEPGDPPNIQNGQVVLWQNGQVWDTLQHAGDGYYLPSQSGIVAQQGVNYEVRATAPGYEPVSASGFVPPLVPIQSFSYQEVLDSNSSNFGQTELKVLIDDPQGTNYYFVAVVWIDTFGLPPNQFYEYYNLFLDAEDPTLAARPLYSNFEFNGLIFSDVSFEGNQKELQLRVFESIDPNRYYHLVLGNLSEDYYRYCQTYSTSFENQGNPFAEPVQIHSNVTGGYGIFAGFNTSEEIF